MKPRRIFSPSRLCLPLASALAALLAIPSANAQILYWDGTTSTAHPDGGNGTWDNLTTSNWDNSPFGGTDIQWDNTLNSAWFGPTPSSTATTTVTLGTGITTRGITFSMTGYTLTGSTLTFGGTNNAITLNNAVTAATINSAIGTSAANMTFTAQNPLTNHTLTFGGAGNWTGSTTVNAGITLALASTGSTAVNALAGTTGITINGGTIASSRNTGGNAQDQISSAAITFNGGGTMNFTNGIGSSFTETIGAVTIGSGQANFAHTNGSSGAGVITTLGGLSRTATTAAVTLSNANPAQTSFRVTGAADTAASEIIGAWATTGTAATAQTDYAIYSGANGIVSARNIAATAQSGWSTTTSATSNYTLANAGGTALDGRLSENRNINTLRVNSTANGLTSVDFTTNETITVTGSSFQNGDVVSFGGTAPGGLTTGTTYYVVEASGDTFSVASTFGGTKIGLTSAGTSNVTAGISLGTSNLGTTGILNAGASGLAIGGNGGSITLPTATAGNLFVTPGNGAQINIHAPIIDNTATGVLTLVKSGSAALNLTGNNTFTGGIVNNAGTTTLSGTNTFTTGAAGATVINGGGVTYSNTGSWGGTGRDVTFNGTGALTSSVAYTGGTLTVNSLANAQIANTGNLAFATTTGTGTIIHTAGSASSLLNLGDASGFTGNVQNRGVAGGTNTGIQFSILGDGGALQFAGGNGDSGQAATFTYSGTGTLTFSTRQVQILDRTSGNWDFRDNTLTNNSANGGNNWVINTDLLVTGGRASTQFGVAPQTGRLFILSGTNTADNAFNGVISNGTNANGIGLSKTAAGKWILGGANTYTGNTSVAAGTLNIQNATALGSTAGGTTVTNGATLQLQGGYSYAAEALTLTNSTSATAILQNVSGNNTWNGTITTTGNTASSFVRIQADAGTLTLAGAINTAANNNGSVVLQGASAINITGKISGTGGLISGTVGAGAGSIRTLSNDNDYTGATSVTGGTLLINGNSSTAVGAVSVAAAGTIGGIGTVGGATTLNGTLSPGQSPGTLTFNTDLTVNNGATYLFESGDLTNVNGILDLNDNWNLTLTGSGFADGGSVVLFNYFGGLAVSPDLDPTINLVGLGFTPGGSLTLTDTGSSIVLNGISAIPEPDVVALIGALGGILLLRRRR